MFFQCLYQHPLLARGHTAEYRIFFHRAIIIFFFFQSRCIDKTLRTHNPRLCRNDGNRQRIVTGNHFDINIIFRKISKGFLCPFADRIGKHHKTKRKYRLCQRFPVKHPFILRKYKHTVAFAAVGGNLFLILGKLPPQNKFRCSDHIRFPIVHHGSGILRFRRKRIHFPCPHTTSV